MVSTDPGVTDLLEATDTAKNPKEKTVIGKGTAFSDGTTGTDTSDVYLAQENYIPIDADPVSDNRNPKGIFTVSRKTSGPSTPKENLKQLSEVAVNIQI